MSDWLTLPFRVVGLLAWFAWQVLKSNGVVVFDILTRRDISNPSIVRVELPGTSNVEGAIVLMMVSLTPGTLVVANEQDPITVYVHSMYQPPAAIVAEVQDMARRVSAALRVGTTS